MTLIKLAVAERQLAATDRQLSVTNKYTAAERY